MKENNPLFVVRKEASGNYKYPVVHMQMPGETRSSCGRITLPNDNFNFVHSRLDLPAKYYICDVCMKSKKYLNVFQNNFKYIERDNQLTSKDVITIPVIESNVNTMILPKEVAKVTEGFDRLIAKHQHSIDTLTEAKNKVEQSYTSLYQNY